MANSVDPNQTAPIGAVCSGSTLFASILNSSVMLGNYLQQTTSAGNTFQMHFFLGALRVKYMYLSEGAQWPSGKVVDSRPKGPRFEPKPRKNRPCLTDRLLIGRKESNQTNKQMYLSEILCVDLANFELRARAKQFSFSMFLNNDSYFMINTQCQLKF